MNSVDNNKYTRYEPIKKIISILCTLSAVILLGITRHQSLTAAIDEFRLPVQTSPNPIQIPITPQAPAIMTNPAAGPAAVQSTTQAADQLTNRLTDVTAQLTDGTTRLTDGTTRLTDGTTEKSEYLPETHNNISSSVTVTPENVNTGDLTLYAKSACLMDAASGRILYSKDAHTPMPMASTTKIMTCILALEMGNPSDIVKASKKAAGMPDVQLNMEAGEEFYLGDLLYSLMLESHNDTAVAIAEHIGGSIEGFADIMNKKAAELGCTDTCYVTPNGLDSGNHHSTAVDLCRIASYAVKNQEFLNLIRTPSHTFSNMSVRKKYTVNNHDAFLGMYDGAIGIKTGFTGKAGYCFVGGATRNNVTLVSAVLASGWPPHKTYKWSDTKKLMDYGYTNYYHATLLSGPIPLNPLPVIDENGYCNSAAKEVALNLTAEHSMLISPNDTITLDIILPSSVNASVTSPIMTGDVIGNAILKVNGLEVNEYPVTAGNDVTAYEFRDYWEKILKCFIP